MFLKERRSRCWCQFTGSQNAECCSFVLSFAFLARIEIRIQLRLENLVELGRRGLWRFNLWCKSSVGTELRLY